MRTMPTDQIQYSEKYNDDKYEYRHVILPVDLAKNVPKSHLMTETEWRNLGVQQSPNWVHYMMHGPESGLESLPGKLSNATQLSNAENPGQTVISSR
ncbi:cyclin-dependent kinases regulatory subunit 1-like isoform X4 [Belonocnema kinseyi]|uniref:cyclin-dependent kinases regulatory subunit 1-like isoform X4 n=1 Tax=Belonocnema kinseyi TaxID=2817044 RepID=UPI00143D54F3|nr:cyclin-dependent kinases regulatory subunit 1-like isoform X4 [Belonocnema kinseyi]